MCKRPLLRIIRDVSTDKRKKVTLLNDFVLQNSPIKNHKVERKLPQDKHKHFSHSECCPVCSRTPACWSYQHVEPAKHGSIRQPSAKSLWHSNQKNPARLYRRQKVRKYADESPQTELVVMTPTQLMTILRSCVTDTDLPSPVYSIFSTVTRLTSWIRVTFDRLFNLSLVTANWFSKEILCFWWKSNTLPPNLLPSLSPMASVFNSFQNCHGKRQSPTTKCHRQSRLFDVPMHHSWMKTVWFYLASWKIPASTTTEWRNYAKNFSSTKKRKSKAPWVKKLDSAVNFRFKNSAYQLIVYRIHAPRSRLGRFTRCNMQGQMDQYSSLPKRYRNHNNKTLAPHIRPRSRTHVTTLACDVLHLLKETSDKLLRLASVTRFSQPSDRGNTFCWYFY